MKKIRNQVRLIGNVGALPVLKTFDSGQTNIRFSIATNDHYKDKDGNKIEMTEWHNIVAWGKTAELAAGLLDKGKEIALEGKLKRRTYEDKDGVSKQITEIHMQEFLILSKKDSVNSTKAAQKN